MKRVLIIADLEGISGVDELSMLGFGDPRYPFAARRMTEETALVARALRARGVEHLRISDAHRSGGPQNLDPSLLPEGCEICFTDDMYGGAVLDDVDGVVCVGMHAAGMTEGFGAHTVALNVAWSIGEAPLSETHLAAHLAAERGIPFLGSMGDDVLGRQLGNVPYVVTKHSRSVRHTQSRALEVITPEVDAMLERPGTIWRVADGPLRVRLQTRAEADAAEGVPHVTRLSATSFEVHGDSFCERYQRALVLGDESSVGMLARGRPLSPGSPGFGRVLASFFDDPWE